MKLLRFLLPFVLLQPLQAQDTFSIVAIDTATGEVGSAGASCLDNSQVSGGVSIIGDIIPGLGAINTQSFYINANQNNARNRLLMGDTPAEVIQWLIDNDIQNDSTVRQYGIAAFDSTGMPLTAAFTGSNCFDYKGHITGYDYAIQGNILLGQEILDSMEARFLNAQGSLAERLMASLQGANVPGADTRCANEGVSSLSAYVRVTRYNDAYQRPYMNIIVPQTPFGMEPIDSLQTRFDNWEPPVCEVEIPFNAVIIDSSQTIMGNQTHYWVCTEDTIWLNGLQNTVYLEEGAACYITGGVLNKVYVKAGASYDGSASTQNAPYHMPGSNMLAYGIGTQSVSCDSVVFDYRIAPSGGCVETNTGIWLAAQDFWQVHQENGLIQVHFLQPRSEQGQLILWDIQGRKLQTLEVQAGMSEVEISVGSVSNGVYLLDWKGEKVAVRQKIIIGQ